MHIKRNNASPPSITDELRYCRNDQLNRFCGNSFVNRVKSYNYKITCITGLR